MTVFHDYYKFRNNVYKLGSDTKFSNFPWAIAWLVVIILLTLASPIVSNFNLTAGSICLGILFVAFVLFMGYVHKVSKSPAHEQKLKDLENEHWDSIKEEFDQIYVSKENQEYLIDQTTISFLVEMVKADIDVITDKVSENVSSAYSSTIISTAVSFIVNVILLFASDKIEQNFALQLLASFLSLVILIVLVVCAQNIKQVLQHKQEIQLSNLRYIQYFLETTKAQMEKQATNEGYQKSSPNMYNSSDNNASTVNVDANISSPSSMNTTTRVNSNPDVIVDTNVDCESGLNVSTNVDFVSNIKVSVNISMPPKTEVACGLDNSIESEAEELPDSTEISDIAPVEEAVLSSNQEIVPDTSNSEEKHESDIEDAKEE
ncbi:MAG: hypothetical protein IKE94_16315 [Aeriscardovia sp.]|nr:hypothetical protein [Aeriscardovia sp.]